VTIERHDRIGANHNGLGMTIRDRHCLLSTEPGNEIVWRLGLLALLINVSDVYAERDIERLAKVVPTGRCRSENDRKQGQRNTSPGVR
jgi:hypothetical protein